jgi:hypothetical protein
MAFLLFIQRAVGRFEDFFIRGDIRGHRLRSILGIPILCFDGGNELGNLAFRIIEIAKDPSFSHAVSNAGRFLDTGGQSVTAIVAFVYDPQVLRSLAFHFGDIFGVFCRIIFYRDPGMEVSGSIWASLQAPPTADAKVAIDHHHPIFPFISCTFYRTGQYTGGIIAVIAKLWEKMPLGHRVSARIGEIHFGPEIACRDGVLHFAAYLARGATYTSPDVHK